MRLILSRGDSGKHTLQSRAGEEEHSELMVDLREMNDKVEEGYKGECGNGGGGSLRTCKCCGDGWY